LRKVLAALLALVVLVAAAAAAVPMLVDWTGHRDAIAARVAAATGSRVAIAGDVSVRVLPTPALSVGSVAVDAGGVSLEVGRLDARLSLLPLLGGRLQATSVELVSPVLTLSGAPADAARALAAATRRDGAAGSAPADAIRLDDVRVRDGVLAWTGPDGTTLRATGVQGELVAGSLAGPFRVAADARVGGVPVRVEASTSRPTDAGALPVRASAVVGGGAATVRFAGLLHGGADVRAQGELRAEGPSLGAAMRAVGLDAPGVPDRAFSLRATAEAAGERIALRGAEGRVGDAGATGALSVEAGRPPRIEASVAVTRLDLDAVLAALGPLPPPGDFAMPRAEATLDLTADAAVLAGRTARQLRLAAVLSDGTLAVSRLSAQLPAGAEALAAGTLTEDAGRPLVGATVEARADDLRGLLRALELEPPEVPPDRLIVFRGAARIDGTPDAFQVSDIDVSLDTARATGAVSVALGDRVGLGLRLSVDSLNLDAYRLPGAPADPGRLAEQLAAAASAADANADVEIGELTVGGQRIRDAVLAGTLSGGALRLTELRVGDWNGVTASVQGTVGDVSAFTPLDLDVAVAAAGLAAPMRAAGLSPPDWAQRLGAVEIGGSVAGTREEAAVQLAVGALGGTLEAGGTLKGRGGDAALDVAARLRLPRTGDLVRLLAPDWRPAGEAPGPLDLYARIAADGAGAALTDLRGAVGPTTAAGAVRIGLDGDRPRIEADLQTSPIPLERFLPGGPDAGPDGLLGLWRSARSPIPAEALRAADGRLALTTAGVTWRGTGVSDAALEATLEDGTLTLGQLDARAAGGAVGLKGRLAAGPPGAPLEAEAQALLVRVALPDREGSGLPLAGGALDAEFSLSGRGRSPSDLLATLSGSGRTAAFDGRLPGFDLGAAAARIADAEDPRGLLDALGRAVSGGDTRYGRLAATWTVEDGAAETGDLRIEGPFGSAEARGRVDLARGVLDVHASVGLGGGLPPFGLVLAGPLDRPSRTLDVAALQTELVERTRRAATPGPAPEPAPAPQAPVPAAPPAQAPDATAPQDPAPAPARDRDEVIRGLLRGMIR
jgi:uncharacterized protein involved in outer membrane biogenesis